MTIKPKPHTVENFVDSAKMSTKEEKATLYLLRISPSLRIKVKMKAAEEGKNMSDLICEILGKSL